MALCIRQFCLKNRLLLFQLNKFKTVNSIIPLRANTPVETNHSKNIHIDLNFNNINKQHVGKPSLLQRFKEMYRSYWYVLLPVHLLTSAAWFGSFYYLARSGIDLVGILECWNVNEKITHSLKDSSMGYIAMSYAMYKVATPIRYTVTLGGTTISINHLKQWGYIKPMPTNKSRIQLNYNVR